MMHFSSASILDRAILQVSPIRGVKRIEARARANILMNYDAGGQGRRVKGMPAPATDADAASEPSRRLLRQRSRDLIRNAPFARRGMTVVSNNVVGAGILPTITGPNKSKASVKAAEDAGAVILTHLASASLDAHGALNLSAMQTVVCNSLFESGEVLALRRTRENVPAGGLPLAIELLEIDHLDATVQSFRDGGVVNEVIDGIEYDAQGVVVAYHIYEKHPGASRWTKRSLKSKRVPAIDVLHIRRIDRPGQVRGVPWLAPVMVTMKEMRDYQEAQILKQKISALLVGVIEAGDAGVPKDGAGLDKMSPGQLVHTEAGQKVVFSNPPQVNDYDVVMRLGLCAAAMGLGITYESLAGDLGRVNFSSARIGRLEMDKNIETWQTQILIGQFCAGVGRWSLDAYRLRPKAKRGMKMSWTAQRRAIIDPTKEIPAIIKKVEGGLSSMQREQRAMGLDPEVIARERQEDADRAPKLEGEPLKPEKGNTS